MVADTDIKAVYKLLKERKIHPSGEFDNSGRWYALHDHLISVRSPSRRWPYSQLVACRTLKYVRAVARYYECETKEQLLKLV